MLLDHPWRLVIGAGSVTLVGASPAVFRAPSSSNWISAMIFNAVPLTARTVSSLLSAVWYRNARERWRGGLSKNELEGLQERHRFSTSCRRNRRKGRRLVDRGNGRAVEDA